MQFILIIGFRGKWMDLAFQKLNLLFEHILGYFSYHYYYLL